MIGAEVDREKERTVTFCKEYTQNNREHREDELFLTIERLRVELLEVAKQRSLSDCVVLELSQKLDGYILLAQHRMMENLRSRKRSITMNKSMVHP